MCDAEVHVGGGQGVGPARGPLVAQLLAKLHHQVDGPAVVVDRGRIVVAVPVCISAVHVGGG